jgi:hypothetical protein
VLEIRYLDFFAATGTPGHREAGLANNRQGFSFDRDSGCLSAHTLLRVVPSLQAALRLGASSANRGSKVLKSEFNKVQMILNET